MPTIIFLVFAAIFTKIGFENCVAFLTKPQMTPVLNISMIYVYGAMPIGMGLTVIRLLQQIWRKLRGTELTEVAQ